MEDTVSFFSAFIAGMVSFFSPCVLPVLPTYTALLAGAATRLDKKKINQLSVLINASCFFLGFVLVFATMGATASLLGQLFFEHQAVVRKISGIVIMIMGIQLTGILQLPLLARDYRPFLPGEFHGSGGAFLLGIAFTTGWTPCIGPILASILLYTGATATLGKGIMLLLVYAAGFAIPFLIMALLLNRYLYKIKALYGLLPYIQKGAGAVLVIVGIMIYFDLMQQGLGIIWNAISS